ncbi:hypothetical protein D3C86_1649630 [compost metagenome]
MKIFGNRGPGWKGAQAQGVGISARGSQFGSWVTLTGEAGEVAYAGVSQTVTGTYENAVAVQANAAVTLEFTLSEENLVTNGDPLVAESATWGSSQSVAAGDIVELNNGLPFTGMKITFTADTVIQIMAR